MILQSLRSGTTALHERVERTVNIPGHLGSLPAYTAMLARFHGFYAPLEDRLAGIGGYESVGLDIAVRHKAHLIRDDLRALGYVAALPVCSTPVCHWHEDTACAFALPSAARRDIRARHWCRFQRHRPRQAFSLACL